MQTLQKQLRRFTAGGILLREVRGMRQELQGLRAAVERIAGALEARNAHEWPQQVQANPDVPAVEIAYVNDQYQARILDITARLTQASGQLPSDEAVFEEYLRRYPESTEAQDFLTEMGGLPPTGTAS